MKNIVCVAPTLKTTHTGQRVEIIMLKLYSNPQQVLLITSIIIIRNQQYLSIYTFAIVKNSS